MKCEMIARKMICLIGTIGLVMLGFLSTSQAVPISFDFTFENDGDLTNQPFGTLTVDGDTADTLSLTIWVDPAKIGPVPDIHEFGFMLDFASPLTFIGSEISGTPGPGSLPGAGSRTLFDWVVNFGDGGPKLNPVSFSITGTGLTLDALFTAGSTTQRNKPDAPCSIFRT